MAYVYEWIGEFEKALWAANKYIESTPDKHEADDTRGDIWRVSEGHCINYYDEPTFWTTLETHVDLLAVAFRQVQKSPGQSPLDDLRMGIPLEGQPYQLGFETPLNQLPLQRLDVPAPENLALLAGAPLWVQLVVFLLIKDFVEWNIHRLLHNVSWLWELHKLHHSIEELDWIGNFRFHWGEVVVYKTLSYLPLVILGIDGRVMLAISIQGYDPIVAVFERLPETGAQSSSLTLIWPL